MILQRTGDDLRGGGRAVEDPELADRAGEGQEAARGPAVAGTGTGTGTLRGQRSQIIGVGDWRRR